MSTPPDGTQPPPQGPSGGSQPPGGDPYAAPPAPRYGAGQPHGPGQPHGTSQPYGPGPGYQQGYGPGPQPGYGQGYPDGAQPVAGPPTDIVSVLGLVFAFLLAPVGLVLSIVGIARTRDGRRKGRGLAIAGIVVSVLLSLVLAGVVVALVAFGAWFNTTVQEIEQGNPGLFEELEEGAGAPTTGTGGLDELQEQLDQLLPSTPAQVDPASALPLGETTEVGVFAVAVTDVDLDATDDLVGQGNPEPDGRYVVVTADVTNTSDEPQGVFLGLNASYLSAAGTSYDEFSCTATFDGQASSLQPLEAGATTPVSWCLVVPEDEAGGGVVVVAPTFDLTGAGTAVWEER